MNNDYHIFKSTVTSWRIFLINHLKSQCSCGLVIEELRILSFDVYKVSYFLLCLHSFHISCNVLANDIIQTLEVVVRLIFGSNPMLNDLFLLNVLCNFLDMLIIISFVFLELVLPFHALHYLLEKLNFYCSVHFL